MTVGNSGSEIEVEREIEREVRRGCCLIAVDCNCDCGGADDLVGTLTGPLIGTVIGGREMKVLLVVVVIVVAVAPGSLSVEFNTLAMRS